MTHEMVDAHKMITKALIDAQDVLQSDEIKKASPSEVWVFLNTMRDTIRAYEDLCAEAASRN